MLANVHLKAHHRNTYSQTIQREFWKSVQNQEKSKNNNKKEHLKMICLYFLKEMLLMLTCAKQWKGVLGGCQKITMCLLGCSKKHTWFSIWYFDLYLWLGFPLQSLWDKMFCSPGENCKSDYLETHCCTIWCIIHVRDELRTEDNGHCPKMTDNTIKNIPHRRRDNLVWP